MNRKGQSNGLGVIGVIIIVLLVLWFLGMCSKSRAEDTTLWSEPIKKIAQYVTSNGVTSQAGIPEVSFPSFFYEGRTVVVSFAYIPNQMIGVRMINYEKVSPGVEPKIMSIIAFFYLIETDGYAIYNSTKPEDEKLQEAPADFVNMSIGIILKELRSRGFLGLET